jgi:FMN reductase
MVPYIVGLGGTTRASSLTERILRVSLQAAEARGAKTTLLGFSDLQLPLFPSGTERTPEAQRLVEEIRRADGIVLASPGYHGTLSGLVKNALDYVEDLRADPRPYFDGRAVGCIAVAHGWQAAVSTLAGLRSVVHALRGWPTPLGAAINSSGKIFDDDGALIDAQARMQLEIVGQQVTDFAFRFAPRS